ncbi:MAG: type I restriction endonuclease subunit R [Candidatus Electrothrix communis]|nr:MAG: type I restriction endonuclease subunit R [Candidatus Electrothrix communis]
MTEAEIEKLAIECFQPLGYKYFYGPDVAPNGKNPLRNSFDEYLLAETLRSAISRLNPDIPHSAQEDAFNQVERIHSPDLISNNKEFHHLLTEGVKVTVRKDGNDRGEIVWLVDFDSPENNEFFVINQFTATEKNKEKRPDLVLFINGLPLVVIELKNPTDEQATLQSAFRQLDTYKSLIPSLFTYNAILIISDGLEARAGSLSAGFNRFMVWKSADGKTEASCLVSQLETLIAGMLNRETLLDLVHHFIVFEQSKTEDRKTGLTSIKTVKKLAAYHQYYAVNKAIESTIKAASNNGNRKGGVVWHTQGSGKSLSMVFYTGKLVLALNNPTVVVITDRNDLDDQLFDTFAAAQQLIRQKPVQAKDRQHLKALLQVASGGVVFTTIQKFQPEQGNVYEQLSDRKNIVVIADEAHRTQYGFQAKTIDDKDEQGQVIGKKTVYGFAKYMRDALPKATYLGFTGTPIESSDVNTPAIFGDYVHIYDISQAVEDGSTVRIYYESRLARITLTEEGRELVEELDDELDQEDLSGAQQAKAKWTQLEALIGSKERVKNVAQDLIRHFEQRQEVFQGKGMIVAMSRRIAADLYREIIALQPGWHNDELSKGTIKVVMTAKSSEGGEIAKHHTTKQERRTLAERMRNPEDPLQLVIVRDMWLTGFDAPSLHTLYIDKPMKGHNLMQAIARVNRVYGDKPGGLVVDYLGIASDLKKALSFYADSGGKGEPAVAQEQAVALLLEKLEIVSQMFDGFAYEEYFAADTSRKLSLILAAEDHILGLENGKKRFQDEVVALSKAFALAVPHEQALDCKDEVAFFQAIKARLAKFSATEHGRTDEEREAVIRQVIDQALVSHQMIDIFDAAGIKKPDISIISEEFLLEIREMEHKNIALEVLKKLLNDEIRARAKKNLVQSNSLMEMLEDSIKRYHNKIITAAEVMEELIQYAKKMQGMDREAEEMGLTDFEYAFYTAVANNDSAVELMQKDTLRELAVVLTEKVRANASIDWTIKEDVRAKLKVLVKRTLRKYGYPPDMQKLATETVLKQAEHIADELTGG